MESNNTDNTSTHPMAPVDDTEPVEHLANKLAEEGEEIQVTQMMENEIVVSEEGAEKEQTNNYGLLDALKPRHSTLENTPIGGEEELEVDQDILDAVTAATAARPNTSANATGFGYHTATSSEEVAMFEALLRRTSTSEADTTTVALVAGSPTHEDHLPTAASQPMEDSASSDHAHTLHSIEHCCACSGDDSIHGNQIMNCINCHRSYHQLCHDPVVEDEVAEHPEQYWHCHDCSADGDENVQEAETESDARAHFTKHKPVTPAVSGRGRSRRMEQAVSGIGIDYQQKKSYLTTLPKSVLINLVLSCDATHPDMPLFPASLHLQAAADVTTDTPTNTDLDSTAYSTSPANQLGLTKSRTSSHRKGVHAGSGGANRTSTLLPAQISHTTTVTGLTPRRTQGRRAPRSAAGLPLPSYEDLCVEAVLNMQELGGSLPKRIFEWIASNYPVAPIFRPSCSQALQRAYRKGKLEKNGRSYKVSQSELEHIQRHQENLEKDTSDVAASDGDKSQEPNTDEFVSLPQPQLDVIKEELFPEGAADTTIVVADGKGDNLVITENSQFHTYNDPSSTTRRESIEASPTLDVETTAEDTAAIVAAVSSAPMLDATHSITATAATTESLTTWPALSSPTSLRPLLAENRPVDSGDDGNDGGENGGENVVENAGENGGENGGENEDEMDDQSVAARTTARVAPSRSQRQRKVKRLQHNRSSSALTNSDHTHNKSSTQQATTKSSPQRRRNNPRLDRKAKSTTAKKTKGTKKKENLKVKIED